MFTVRAVIRVAVTARTTPSAPIDYRFVLNGPLQLSLSGWQNLHRAAGWL